MKFVQAYSNYNSTNFQYRPNREKIKDLRKKLNFPILSKNPRLGKTLFSKNLALSCTTPHEPLTPCRVLGENFQTEGRTDLIHMTLLAMVRDPIRE